MGVVGSNGDFLIRASRATVPRCPRICGSYKLYSCATLHGRYRVKSRAGHPLASRASGALDGCFSSEGRTPGRYARLRMRGDAWARRVRWRARAPLRANRNGASNASVGRRPASGGAAGAHRVVAEQYAVPLELARSTFQERFPSGSTKLDLRVTECGRGLVATAPIEEGEVLLSVPWEETIHVTEDGYDDPDDVRLAMELLHVLNHGGNGDEDPRVPVWARYRPMLPTSTGAAAFWRPENIRELQFEEAVDKTSELSMKFNEYALRHADQNNPTENIMWALAMVHSRSFSVCTPTGRARVLVPYADLFNHRP